MKNFKKILSAFLAVMMLLSCVTIVMADETVVSSGALSDVDANARYATAVKNLNAMGIIKGYEDGTFKPEQNVTRAEFTAMLMRTLNLGDVGSTSPEGLPFSDIDPNASDYSSYSWAIPNIHTAYGKGIINGYEDGTFRPNDNVAYEEAVKMIVCTLGYGTDVDVSTTPWYTGFIAIGNQIGVTRVASEFGKPETAASRACIAQLLYDSLEIKLIENDKKTDKTILSDYLGYTKLTGIIYSNDITSLTSPDVNLREDEIQIYARDKNSSTEEVHTYITTDSTLKNYLGYQVEFYYASNDGITRNLLFCVLKGNEPVVVNAKNFERGGTTDTLIKYYENIDDEREKSLSLNPDNIVIYNSKLYGSNAYESRFTTDMIPEVGSVKFIDSDNDKKYDIVDITEYEVYYVSTKTTTTYEVVDNILYHYNKVLKLDESADRNLKIVGTNGNAMDFNSIATGNIICVAQSNYSGGDVVTKAVVVQDKVTGTVTATNKDKITIGGTEYRSSNIAPWIAEGKDAPQLDDSGTFSLDINGDIAVFVANATSENVSYGYIEGYGNEGSSFDDNVVFRIFTSTGKTEYLGTYKGTKVNGETCSTGSAVVNLLKQTAKTQNYTPDGYQEVQQLIKYTTRSSGGENVLEKIYTAESVSTGAEVKSNTLTVLDRRMGLTDNMTYTSSAKVLSNDQIKVSVNGATVITVPEDRSSYDDFRKSSMSYFKKGCKVDIYDISAANSAKIVVIYGVNTSKEADLNAPINILSEMSQSENPKTGDIMYLAEGYKASASNGKGTFSSWISKESDSVYKNMDKGAIFRTGTDKDGFATIKEDNVYYQVGGINEFGRFILTGQGETEDDKNSNYVRILGSVVASDDSTVSIIPERLDAKEDDEEEGYDRTKVQLYNISSFKDAQVLIYDYKNDKLELIEGEYEPAIASLQTYESGVEPSKVFIFAYKNVPKLLCILPVDTY